MITFLMKSAGILEEYKVALCFVCYQVTMKLSKVTSGNRKVNWEPAAPLTTSSFG